MKLNIVKVEVPPRISLKNGVPRFILRGLSSGPKWATYDFVLKTKLKLFKYLSTLNAT